MLRSSDAGGAIPYAQAETSMTYLHGVCNRGDLRKAVCWLPKRLGCGLSEPSRLHGAVR